VACDCDDGVELTWGPRLIRARKPAALLGAHVVCALDPADGRTHVKLSLSDVRAATPKSGSPDARRPASKSEEAAGGASAASAPRLRAHPPCSAIHGSRIKRRSRSRARPARLLGRPREAALAEDAEPVDQAAKGSRSCLEIVPYRGGKIRVGA